MRCQVTLTAEPRVVPPDGGTATVTVDSARDCTWTAASDAAWTTLNPTSGQGAGTIAVTVAATQQPTTRTAAISVNNGRVDLSQEGRPCRFTLTSASAEVGPPGGPVTVAVSTAAGCSWRATSPVGWIDVPSQPRTGPGPIELTVGPNVGAQRSATITVADQPFIVIQHAAGSSVPVPPNCAPLVMPTRLDVPASAATETVRLEVAAPCAWTAASSAAWLTFVSETPGQPPLTSGQGAATFRVAIAQNMGAARTGTVTIAAQVVTVNQAAAAAPPPPPCTFAIDPESRSFSNSGGEGRVDVDTRDGCQWSVAANVPDWVTILNGRGTGDGQARYRVQANSGAGRATTLTIAGKAHRVTQAAAPPPCTFSLAPASVTVDAAGGERRFTVTAPPGCDWSAAVEAPWVTIVSGSGSGQGEVVYTVAQNPITQPRTAAITIGNQSHGITQLAAAPACTFVVDPESRQIPADGGEGRFTVKTQPGCAWSVTGGEAWVAVANRDGNGPGDVVYTVQPNGTTQSRTATLTVGGRSHAVIQAAAAVCTFEVSPASHTLPAEGGDRQFTLTTQPGCAWSVTGGAGWVTVANPSGSGSGDVVYSVQANSVTQPRGATLMVGGRVHRIEQLAAAPSCTFALQPPQQTLPAAAGEGRFSVVTQSGCGWSASGGAPWITYVVSAGSGSGEVVFNVTANDTPDGRSATIVVGGQTHMVMQAGTPPPCTYTLNPSSFDAPAAGGQNRFNVETQPGCAWNAVSTASWIVIATGSGTGSGEVVYTVDANMSAEPRNALVIVAGQSHSVSQGGTTSTPPPPPPQP